VPGAGGLTYIARRAAEMASAGNANADVFKFLTEGFTAAAMAKVGTSALESRQLGYLVDGDVIELGAAAITYRAWADAAAARTERVTRDR